MEKLSDKELVKRCQSELPYETRAFELLIQRYKDRVFSKILSIINNRQEAEDVAQDVFIKVFHGLPSFRSDSTFSTWLYTITVNTCLNHKEKMRRRPWWWLAEDIEDSTKVREQETALFYLIGESLERNDLRKSIDSTLAQLSEQSRQVLQLRFFDELDYKEISEQLKIGLSATKMRLKRARQEFKERYDKLSKDDEQNE